MTGRAQGPQVRFDVLTASEFRNDVIDVRRAHPQSRSGALSAEWLFSQNLCPQLPPVCPVTAGLRSLSTRPVLPRNLGAPPRRAMNWRTHWQGLYSYRCVFIPVLHV
jgi:hypothetical protein